MLLYFPGNTVHICTDTQIVFLQFHTGETDRLAIFIKKIHCQIKGNKKNDQSSNTEEENRFKDTH